MSTKLPLIFVSSSFIYQPALETLADNWSITLSQPKNNTTVFIKSAAPFDCSLSWSVL